MKCWVCKRHARGYGHTDNRHGVGDPRRYPIDWVFCSRRCQDAFHALYGNWQRAKEGRIDKTEVAMIDPSDVELAAMRHCLKAFGEADVDREIAADNQRADDLGLIFDSDPRYTSKDGGSAEPNRNTADADASGTNSTA